MAAMHEPVKCARASGQTLSPETFAVLACAQAVLDERNLPRFRRAVAACTSAERLCETAVRHGMLGHLHRLVSAESDPALAAFARERLAELYRLSAERALRQTGQLLRLIDRLHVLGIEAMPVKGPAWAERLYGDVTLRSWVDLDLVVRYEQVPAARAALLEAGMRDDSPFNERLVHRRTRTEGEIHFHSAENDLRVDVHWQIGVGRSADALSAQWLLSRAESRTLLGRDVLAPSASDMLLMTCLHGTRHRWDSVEGLLALVRQVCGLAEADWPGVMAAAREAGCNRRVTVGVAYACRVFALRAPQQVAAALAGDAIARSLLRSLTPATLCTGGAATLSPQVTDMLWNASTEDDTWASMEHAASRALRPGPEDWQTVRLPAGSEWLYYALRPFRLGVKWASRLGLSRL